MIEDKKQTREREEKDNKEKVKIMKETKDRKKN